MLVFYLVGRNNRIDPKLRKCRAQRVERLLLVRSAPHKETREINNARMQPAAAVCIEPSGEAAHQDQADLSAEPRAWCA